MKILGVDQSFTSSGWSLLEDGELTHYGIITSDKNKTAYERASNVAEELLEIAVKHKIDKLVIEGIPFMARSNVTRDLAGLQFVIIHVFGANEVGKDIHIVPPTQLKKFATGSGTSTKDGMFEALPPEVSVKFASTPKSRGRFDLTDAYWLAKHGESIYE